MAHLFFGENAHSGEVFRNRKYSRGKTGCTGADSNQPSIRPPEDKNRNNINDWEEKFNRNDQSVAVVLEALKEKQQPLLAIGTLPISSSKIYRLSDLKLADQENELLLADYGRELVQIMSDYHKPSLGNELILVSEAVNGNNEREIQGDIIKLANRYKISTNKLLALTAPRSAGQIHLNLINNLERLSENAWLMTQIYKEPIIALGAAQLQTSRLRQILTAIGNVNLFFAGHNLGLENKETGIARDL